ncbi:tryptophan--tRNA ligase [Phytomonospora endophytica]|uniref:Tryptophan--tRNA ligase n=1 Tax=Phytomonospora endophytica TaxID=714109 RepID=A0A841FI72_9ACTN|nr:tryptophan--tRNA ligase [Phytomonospora endophytica]MBB6035906.1 tryptophanyl-tRNA synthetase [Phytomonospora endophytica]GIG71097.1 tryptophan--tRNA ligase [Phytomonospora endophytica]
MSTTTVPRDLELSARVLASPQDFRVLTGDRPTGALHVGHYFGTLHNRVLLQDLGVEMFVLVADYQVITDRDVTGRIGSVVEGIVLDYLAAGLDPERATIFAHSAVPALNQLVLPFLSLVSTSELSRNPTVKEEIASSGRSMVSGLMFTYPVHQAADLLFCKSNLVPVGDDQLPHIELTRTIARRFNDRYRPLFPLPEAMLSTAPRLLGTDGAKMGKSSGNSIELRATADETARVIRGAKTDAERRITFDPVNRPEVSNLVLLAALAGERDPHDVADEVGDGGAAVLKRTVTEAVNECLRPMRERRLELAAEPGLVHRVLSRGNETADAIAESTLAEVREAMGTRY